MNLEVRRRAERLVDQFSSHIGEPYVIFSEQGLKTLGAMLHLAPYRREVGPQRWWIGIASYNVTIKNFGLSLSPTLYTRVLKRKTTGFRLRNGFIYYGAPPGDPLAVDESNVERRVGRKVSEPYDVELRLEPNTILSIEQIAAFYAKSEYIRNTISGERNWNKAAHTIVAFGDRAGLLLLNPWKYQADSERNVRPLAEHILEGRAVLEAILNEMPTS